MSISSRLGPKTTHTSYSKVQSGLSKEEEMNLTWKHDKFSKTFPEKTNSAKRFSVLIENLHPSATVEDVKASFSHLGNIVDAEYRLVLDQNGGHCGSCILSFDCKKAVDDAIMEFDQKLADGRIYNF